MTDQERIARRISRILKKEGANVRAYPADNRDERVEAYNQAVAKSDGCSDENAELLAAAFRIAGGR